MKKITGVYPSKTTINLVMREKTPLRVSRSVPLLALVLLLAALFGKFAVADQLARVNAARAALSDVRQQQAQLAAQSADYDALMAQYNRYASGWMTDQERVLADRRMAISLVDDVLMAHATVLDFAVTENVLTATLQGLTLDGASALVRELQTNADVADVDLFTASNVAQIDENALVSIVVVLQSLQLPATTEGGDGQ